MGKNKQQADLFLYLLTVYHVIWDYIHVRVSSDVGVIARVNHPGFVGG